MNQGSVASFQGRQHRGGPASAGRQKLLIGPWLHGRRNKGNKVGELVYPANAAVDGILEVGDEVFLHRDTLVHRTEVRCCIGHLAQHGIDNAEKSIKACVK